MGALCPIRLHNYEILIPALLQHTMIFAKLFQNQCVTAGNLRLLSRIIHLHLAIGAIFRRKTLVSKLRYCFEGFDEALKIHNHLLSSFYVCSKK